MPSVDRRQLMRGAGAGALALAGPGLLHRTSAMAQQKPPLVPACRAGLRHGNPRGAARQEAADQAQLPAAQLRDAGRISRRLLPPTTRFSSAIISPTSPRDRRHDLAAQDRRRGRGHSVRADAWRELQTGFEQVEIAAVCQCSGNRRGLSQPHVPGVEWGLGAMGNAVWRGVRLKDVLAKAGLRKEAVELVLNGARRPGARQDAGFRQEHPAVEGARREHDHRPSDERPAAAAFQRLPGAADRAGLDRDLLDEAPRHDRGGDEAVRRLLDESGLSHPHRQVPGRRSIS